MKTKIFIFMLIINLCFANILFSQRTITGIVLNKDSQAICCANISAKSGIGTVSDLNGFFILQVPDNVDIIEISYLGMEMQTIKLSKENYQKYSIVLQQLDIVLDEVVIKASTNYTYLIDIFPDYKKNENKDSSIQRKSISKQPDWNVYPNPTYGYLSINSSYNNEFILTDLSGKVLQVINMNGMNLISINLQQYAAGTYLIKPNNKAVNQSIKIILIK